MSIGSAADVVNVSLELIASQSRITSLTDGTDPAQAANIVYAPTVQLMLREVDPDFARRNISLTLSAAPTPTPPWAYEYLYPADAARIRTLTPATNGYDVNNPLPIRWNVYYDIISASPTKVIGSNQVNARAVFTSLSVPEALWDAVFVDAVARRLANPLAMALSGRPDFAREILEESARVASTAEMVDESSVRRMG